MRKEKKKLANRVTKATSKISKVVMVSKSGILPTAHAQIIKNSSNLSPQENNESNSTWPKGQRTQRKLRLAVLIAVILFCGVLIGFFVRNADYLGYLSAKKSITPFETDSSSLVFVMAQNQEQSREVIIHNRQDLPLAVTAEILGHEGLIIPDKNLQEIAGNSSGKIMLWARSADAQKNAKFLPGIYAGRLILASGDYRREIPLIVQIESAHPFFDSNIQPLRPTAQIEQGSALTFEINLFRLTQSDETTVQLDYRVMDFAQNTLYKNAEQVLINDTATIPKSIQVPSAIRMGTYALLVKTLAHNTVSTSSYIFEIVPKNFEEKKSWNFAIFCFHDIGCVSMLTLLGMIITLGIILFFIQKTAGPAQEKENPDGEDVAFENAFTALKQQTPQSAACMTNIAEAHRLAKKGNIHDARTYYLHAHTKYISLPNHEKKKVYEHLRDLHSKLSTNTKKATNFK